MVSVWSDEIQCGNPISKVLIFFNFMVIVSLYLYPAVPAAVIQKEPVIDLFK